MNGVVRAFSLTEMFDPHATNRFVRSNVHWGVIPGARVVFVSDAVAAGIDPDALDAWISEHGGRRVTVTLRAHPAAAARTVQVWTVPRGLVVEPVRARTR